MADFIPLTRKPAAPRASAMAFLPTTREEMNARGWDQLDVLIVNGDAYVDHPAFGAALIGRFLEGRGYRVGIISQPRWESPDDVLAMGRPKLFVGTWTLAFGNVGEIDEPCSGESNEVLM